MPSRRAWGLAAIGTLLSGCGGILEACWDADGPVFEEDRLPAATVGQPYDTTVSVHIERNAFDDAYEYEFGSSGQLPPGLQLRHERGTRRVRLVGVPTTAGAYTFRLWVHVREDLPYGPGNFVLCWTDADRTFLVTVAPPG